MLDLQGKTPKERATLKADEVVQLAKAETFERGGYRVEMQSVRKEKDGIVEVFARAWHSGKQLGFGADGTVDIERFRFVNPPTMVPDGTFTTKVFEGKEHNEPNYKTDPQEALRLSLVDTIRQVGKDGSRIVPERVGSTVTTVFASYNAMVYNAVSNQSWATVRDAATGTNVDTTDRRWVWRIDNGTPSTTYNLISRTGFTFDTSAIPDTDTITAATLSIFGDTLTNTNTDSPDVRGNVYDFTPANAAAYATADYDQFGTTAFCDTPIAWSSWSTSAYNDFALNATGIADINKTGNTVLGIRESVSDVTNTPLVSASDNAVHRAGYKSYLASGTTNDPKLVVTHAAAASVVKDIIAMGIIAAPR